VSKPSIQPDVVPRLSPLTLAEPLREESAFLEIDVLLGGDNYYRFVGPDILRFEGGMVLVFTKLGWVTSGVAPASGHSGPETIAVLPVVEAGDETDSVPPQRARTTVKDSEEEAHRFFGRSLSLKSPTKPIYCRGIVKRSRRAGDVHTAFRPWYSILHVLLLSAIICAHVWYDVRPFAKIQGGVSVVKTCEAVTFYQKATGLCSGVVFPWMHQKSGGRGLEVLFMLVASFGVLSSLLYRCRALVNKWWCDQALYSVDYCFWWSGG
jgi:hypothetical protein